jgi:homocysteine S-methyltransferase
MSADPDILLPPLILLDGGLGTTLADRYNCIFDHSTPLWSSHLLLGRDGRTTLRDVQGAFAANGADVILSATYQASFEGFLRSGVADGQEAGLLMRRGVAIARAALGERREGKGGKGGVALSLGAYGATMVPGQEYSGLYDAEHNSVAQLREWHLRRLKVFMPGGEDGEEKEERRVCWENVDFVAFETLPRLDEVFAVREVMERASEDVGEEEEKKFWISCVFPGEGNILPDGSSIKQVVEAMLGRAGGARPMGVGINCTRVGKVEGVVEEFEREIGPLINREGGEWPSLVLYPDGTRGEVYDTKTKEWVKKGGTEESLVSSPLLGIGVLELMLTRNRFLGMRKYSES